MEVIFFSFPSYKYNNNSDSLIRAMIVYRGDVTEHTNIVHLDIVYTFQRVCNNERIFFIFIHFFIFAFFFVVVAECVLFSHLYTFNILYTYIGTPVAVEMCERDLS